jgi:hypothetical protein
MNHGKVFNHTIVNHKEVKIVLERMEPVEWVLCRSFVERDYQRSMFGDGMGCRKENGPNSAAVDLLLESMDWEIFADFRKTLDSSFTDTTLSNLFRATY